EQTITIQNTSSLSKEEVEKMVKDAEANREADQKKRHEIEVIVKAEQLSNDLEKTLKSEQAKNLGEPQKQELQKEIDEIKELINKKDIEQLEKKITEFEQKMAQAAEFLKKQQENNNSNTNNDN
ncbi:TPA: Hsp70 family protein, partial [Neisseria gonorrhoeae]